MKAGPRKTGIYAGGILAANVGLAYVLDALGLVAGMLSPGGAALLYLLPLTVMFYLVRIAALFVVPGLLLGEAVLWLLNRRRP